MAETLSLILTNAGKNMIANAIALKQTIEVTTMALGSGLGTDVEGGQNNESYLPLPTQTTLKNEVYRANIMDAYMDETGKAAFTMLIPYDVGGWYVREVGLFVGSTLFAIGMYPETYKAPNESNVVEDLYIELALIIANAEQVINFTIDPSVMLVTKEYLVQHYTKMVDFNNHIQDTNNPHQVTAEQIGLNFSSIEINQIFNSLKSGMLGAKGWSRDANGYTVQWGQGGAQATAQNKGRFWWSFPVPFSEPCYGISATDYAANETYHHGISVTTLTKSTMSGYVFMRDGSPMTSQETAFFIMAFGKISDEDFAAIMGE